MCRSRYQLWLFLWNENGRGENSVKTRAIIPIFIPHKGCPNDCVFCNQKKITARQAPIGPEDVRQRIESYLPTLLGRGLEIIEIAFFGGSFTGIPMEEQAAYLAVAAEYKDRGSVQKIRLSTRPDYIDDDILRQLRAYGADIIELGVQSFDEEVLRLSNRGHSPGAVEQSAAMIRQWGFDLGIQLMIGLPGDTPAKAIASAREAVRHCPSQARLYPTVVLEDTALYEDWKAGSFQPWDQEQMVDVTKEMYKILTGAGIRVIRVGLKSTDLISGKQGGAAVPGTYHPAFRQLVCGRLAREAIEAQLPAIFDKIPEGTEGRILCQGNGVSFSNMVGNRGENRDYFSKKYPQISFRFGKNDELAAEEYRVSLEGSSDKNCAKRRVTSMKNGAKYTF